MFKVVISTFLAVIAILAMSWMVEGNNFFLYKFFAPKQEQVRREVFEQSNAYRRGTVNDLQALRAQYAKGDADQKAMLASIIKQRASDFPVDAMPYDLRHFIQSLK